MPSYTWNTEKNLTLVQTRGVGFEDVLVELLADRVLDDRRHPNRQRYPNQRLFIVSIRKYAYLVPYVQEGNTLFLKTVIPSRRETRRYLGGQS